MDYLQYLEIIQRELTGQIDEAEQVSLTKWLEKDKANQTLFLHIQQTYEKSQRHGLHFDLEATCQQFVAQQPSSASNIQPTSQTPSTPTYSVPMPTLVSATTYLKNNSKLATAIGCVLLSVMVVVWLLTRPIAKTVATTTDVKMITLPDKSIIWLNKASSIAYTMPFKKRQIELQGEAFFDVQSNPDKPFTVLSGGATINAIGTTFNVRCYPKDQAVEVVVENGEVQAHIGKLSGATSYPLSKVKGNRWIWRKDSNLIETTKNNNPTLWAYRLDSLEFKQQKLGVVFETLERLFDIHIQLSDDYIRKCTFTGTFGKQNPEAILKAIAAAKEFDFDRNSKTYSLSGEGCGKPLTDPFWEEIY